MQKTLPNSPPLIHGDDDVDIDFRDVFGGPPKRRSRVIETTSRHSFSEIRRRDVIVDNSALILRDEKPVFGEDPSIRRRFTADDFFDDIFRVNESSSSPQRKIKNEGETFGSSSLPGSRILSPARPVPHKAESPGTSFPAHFSLPAKLIKGTEIPTFGSAARSLSKNREAASSSPLSKTSSKADMVGSTAKPDSDGYVAPKVVVNGKGRQFHFSIYKWPNKGVPVVMWGSSRLSSMAKAEETTPSDSSGMSEEKKTSQKPPGVQKDEEEMSKQDFSGNASKAREASVKPLHAFLDVKDEKQGTRSSLDSPMPDKSSFPSTSSVPEVGKDGGKGKVMDFVKIFSQGGGGESLGQSSRWRAREVPVTDINKYGPKAKDTVKVSDQQKKSTPVTPSMDQDQKKPSQATQKKVPDNSSKPSGVTEQEERQEPSTAHVTSEDIDEPFHVNFLVEDITQDENKMEETRNDAEEFKNIDAKIRKWSSGKSGNIRSLLSTLQYILWPGCGWKAVPLMDMIEGNAVRKSYQRALLILHPDKLQQKGASANQKYMAEKVFELLQEAWDHFNTLGPV
ncbi:J domain-containing protein required for chloroplast accumulation response 1 [Raphanus sativus]|nr:J domain-containing protein required for chloroplast accumulation response 1 [Raphanus sativus]